MPDTSPVIANSASALTYRDNGIVAAIDQPSVLPDGGIDPFGGILGIVWCAADVRAIE